VLAAGEERKKAMVGPIKGSLNLTDEA
jgi:hypothetical protein